MAWYATGTVAVTNGSGTVTGTGTAFIDNVAVGEGFRGPDGRIYEITAIASATSLSIAPAYEGTTVASGGSYRIAPTQSYIRDLAAQAAELITDFADVRDEAGAGLFASGSLSAPSVRGLSDQDTGVDFMGSNVARLVAGGAAALQWDGSGVVRVNTTTNNSGVGSTCRLQVQGTGADYTASFQNAHASDPYGLSVNFSGASPNGTGNPFATFFDASATRVQLRSNGGIANYSANNVNLSDEREKEGIEAFDAAADLEAFLAFDICNFRYRDQSHDDDNLGVIAQRLLESHPGNERYVDLDGWQKPTGEKVKVGEQVVLEESGVLDARGNMIMRPAVVDVMADVTVPRMSVYDGDLHFRTMAQLQHAHRLIAQLAARIATLEGAE